MKIWKKLETTIRTLIQQELRTTEFKPKFYSVPENSEIHTHSEDGQRVILDPRETFMTFHFLEHGNWEPHVKRVLKATIRAGDWVVDVGANIGLHTIYMAQLTGETGKVLAIEPHPETCLWLYKNIDVNGLNHRVELVSSAMGEKIGEVDFSYFLEHPGMSGIRIAESIASRHNATVINSRVRMETLDSILERKSLEGLALPRLIKIDVEGLELEVLRGAQKTLSAEDAPTFLVEINKQMAEEVMKREASFELESLMREHSFEIFRVELDMNVRLEPGDLQRQPVGDFLFVKRRRPD